MVFRRLLMPYANRFYTTYATVEFYAIGAARYIAAEGLRQEALRPPRSLPSVWLVGKCRGQGEVVGWGKVRVGGAGGVG